MTASSEYVKNATAALHQALHISPSDFDTEAAAAVIEEAIRNATRERESQGPSTVEGGAGRGARASGAVAQLLTRGDLQLQGYW